MCIRDRPKGSGCAGYPIVIDMYGNGNKPVIDGNGSYFMPQIKDWKGPFVGEDGSQIEMCIRDRVTRQYPASLVYPVFKPSTPSYNFNNLFVFTSQKLCLVSSLI